MRMKDRNREGYKPATGVLQQKQRSCRVTESKETERVEEISGNKTAFPAGMEVKDDYGIWGPRINQREK